MGVGCLGDQSLVKPPRNLVSGRDPASFRQPGHMQCVSCRLKSQEEVAVPITEFLLPSRQGLDEWLLATKCGQSTAVGGCGPDSSGGPKEHPRSPGQGAGPTHRARTPVPSSNRGTPHPPTTGCDVGEGGGVGAGPCHSPIWSLSRRKCRSRGAFENKYLFLTVLEAGSSSGRPRGWDLVRAPFEAADC